MRKPTKAAVLVMCIAAISSGTSFASPLVLPSGDSHPIYFDAQNYRQSDADTLKGVFTEKHLDKVAKPSKEALSATKDAVEEVRDGMKLPEELYLLPLKKKDFKSLSVAEKQAYIDGCYKTFIQQTNKAIKESKNADEKEFYGATEKLVRDYLMDDSMWADGKASVTEYFSLHPDKVKEAAKDYVKFKAAVKAMADALQPE